MVQGPYSLGHGLSHRASNSVVGALGPWKWLEELRLRFDLAVELLDADLEYVLDPVPDTRRVVDLRAALQNRSDPTLRDTAAAAVRSAKARSFTMGGLRVRLFPLFVRAATPPINGGVLLIAAAQSARSDADVAASEQIDRLLDAAGQWLGAAIEAAMGSALDQADEARSAQRLAGVLDVLDALSRLDDEEHIIALVMDAIALWYDADVRVYRSDVSGAFVLHSRLPGAGTAGPATQLAGHGIWGRDEVFSLESLRDVEDLGWEGPTADTLLVPISVEELTEWLLMVSGTAGDPSVKLTLGVVRRLVGALLTDLHRNTVERVRRKLGSILAFGDAPFKAVAQIALEAIAFETGAASAQMTIFYGPDSGPAVSIQWGGAEDDYAPFVEAGTATVAEDAIAVGMPAGAGVTAVLGLRRRSGGFPPGSARLARSIASTIGVWLSGTLIKPADVRVPPESEYSSDFVDRLVDQLDRFGRLKVGGAVAVVLPGPLAPTGPQLDEIAQLLQEHVRPSDVIGLVEAAGAAVLLPDATQQTASAVVGRLSEAAHQQGMVAARVGLATFSAFSESPDSLVNRAVMNARRGTAL